MKSFQFIVGIVFILAGCASSYYSYEIQHHQDEFDGFTVDRVSGNYLNDSAANLKNSAWLNMQRFRAKDGSIRYDLIVEYWDTEWLFIGPGESLVCLVDGERMGFTGNGSGVNREVTTGMQSAVVKEQAFYKVLPEQLRSIANAKEVKIKIQGSNRFVTRTLAQENLDNFKRFVSEYVDK